MIIAIDENILHDIVDAINIKFNTNYHCKDSEIANLIHSLEKTKDQTYR